MSKNNNSTFQDNAGFLSSVLDKLSDAVCVVNKNIELVYFNQAFVDVFKSDASDLIGKRFGESIGCEGYESGCPEILCDHCKLRSSMQAAIQSKENQKKDFKVLEMSSGSDEEFMLVQFQCNYLQFEGESFSIVVLSNLTDMGKGTLESINSFYHKTS